RLVAAVRVPAPGRIRGCLAATRSAAVLATEDNLPPNGDNTRPEQPGVPKTTSGPARAGPPLCTAQRTRRRKRCKGIFWKRPVLRRFPAKWRRAVAGGKLMFSDAREYLKICCATHYCVSSVGVSVLALSYYCVK